MREVKTRKLLKILALPLALLLVAVPLAYAGVIVSYPISGTVNYVAPTIVFEGGTNANQTGLGGNTISVTIGQNKTSATFSIHITYQTVEYHDILVIRNTDAANAYWVGFSATTNLPAAVYNATLLITDDTGSKIASYDLLTGGWSGWLFQLPANTTYHVNLIFKMSEGQRLPATPADISLKLYWSNSNTETPFE